MSWKTYVCPECGKEVYTTWPSNGCACKYPETTTMILKEEEKENE